MPILPNEDESAGSLAYRTAESNCKTLLAMCVQDIGLSYSQACGDLDQILPNAHAAAFATACGLKLETIVELAIPSDWLQSVHETGSRKCHGAVRVCPKCVEEKRLGRSFWRTSFAAACAVHGTELVCACPHCGSTITYFGATAGFENRWWLETWPVCTKCLRHIKAVIPAHPKLVQMTKSWFAGLRGCGHSGMSAVDLLTLSRRLLQRFTTSPPHIEALRNLKSVTTWPQHFATTVILRAIINGDLSDAAFNAALGLPFTSHRLAEELHRAWIEC